MAQAVLRYTGYVLVDAFLVCLFVALVVFAFSIVLGVLPAMFKLLVFVCECDGTFLLVDATLKSAILSL